MAVAFKYDRIEGTRCPRCQNVGRMPNGAYSVCRNCVARAEAAGDDVSALLLDNAEIALDDEPEADEPGDGAEAEPEADEPEEKRLEEGTEDKRLEGAEDK